ncbi:FtsB family cell division protein [Leucothrix arctica]|uniref:Cell division protein FtsB n=1 Tax=Leucothrix arctica TaxID=1481894 RepID=A0A317CBY4_9GAMM|nr:septum formation initiator family protein [Leucothrix arctica]PWQ95887.1 cell division protein FtsB [Leucothrix arctica]
MKYLITVMFALLVLLLASLWIGHGSYPAKWQLEKEIATLDKQNEHQEELNRQIRAELEDAQSGSDAVEERARSELGMIRNQETFFEVILEPTDTQQLGAQSIRAAQVK